MLSISSNSSFLNLDSWEKVARYELDSITNNAEKQTTSKIQIIQPYFS